MKPKIFSKIKGVGVNYNMVSNISNYMLLESEKYQFLDVENSNFIVVGLDVANKLNLSVANTYNEAINQVNFFKTMELENFKRKTRINFCMVLLTQVFIQFLRNLIIIF